MAVKPKEEKIRDVSNDEIVDFEDYGDDYTIKVFKTPSDLFYSTVVYEMDDSADCIFESPIGNNRGKQRIDAISSIRRHQKLISKEGRK